MSFFPRPRHALFPKQADTNKAVTDVLDTELSAGRDAAQKAEEAAAEYHKALEAVRAFNPYDLYSKSDEPVDVEKVKPYYQGLIAKFFPEVIEW